MARSRFKLPPGNSLSAICFLHSIVLLVVATTALQPPVRTYIAEWEFQKHQWKGLNGSTRPLLRHRTDAGYWSEPSGTSGDWWLFGGKGFEKQYSDLWKFHGNTLQWERIYPKSDPIVRAMVAPERIPQPILCGHQTPGRTVLAVYGPKLHTDTVWLYEVNDTLWTSYVCCTEKQNSKHTFCPDFSHSKQSPVAWCDTTNGALLAVVPTSTALQLWRFSLLTTRWEHVSLQLTTPATVNPKSKIICNFTDESSLLYTFTDGLLYILCADNTSNSTLKRYVYRYPNAYGELEPLGIISLNVIPQKISLTATKTNNGKIYLIIAYQQLIDIWLLDENTLSWIAIDNIWEGNSLKWFQAISSDSGIYYLNIDHSYVMLSNPKLNEQKSDNPKLNEQKSIGVIQEQGIFMIRITEDDGSILRGMKKPEIVTTTTTTTETPETTKTTTTTTTKIPEITTTSSTTTTTTEWSPELVMEGSPENISTCCWNFTETIVGNDRALLAISPQVNEVTRPLKASPPEKPESKSSYGTIIFFVMSLSLIAVSGAILFVRRCVKCPESNTPTILKEPPPIRYSVIPDELTYPTYPGA